MIFTFFWTNGERETIEAETVEDGFSKLGYGGNAINALDFFVKSEKPCNNYIFKDNNWRLKTVHENRN